MPLQLFPKLCPELGLIATRRTRSEAREAGFLVRYRYLTNGYAPCVWSKFCPYNENYLVSDLTKTMGLS